MPGSHYASISIRLRNTSPVHRPQVGRRGVLVEDEPSVRTVLRRMLEMYGLRVIPVESPDQAIAVSQSREDPVDALLTDLQLPGMSGLELALLVRKLRPDVPVVCMSGYAREEAFGHAAREYAGAEFLQKPFTPTQLAGAMGRALLLRTPPPADDTLVMPALDDPS